MTTKTTSTMRVGFGSAAAVLAQPGTFTTDDGIRLSFHHWGSDDAGVPVLLRHGLAASMDVNWMATGVVAALVDAGRSVIAVDTRGRGHSDKPHDPQRHGEARMARDMSELLDHLGAGRQPFADTGIDFLGR